MWLNNVNYYFCLSIIDLGGDKVLANCFLNNFHNNFPRDLWDFFFEFWYWKIFTRDIYSAIRIYVGHICALIFCLLWVRTNFIPFQFRNDGGSFFTFLPMMMKKNRWLIVYTTVVDISTTVVYNQRVFIFVQMIIAMVVEWLPLTVHDTW